jgi:preprotein translocase subunit SecG
MNWIGILLLVIHVLACSGLILIVLLQAGKGASLGAAFGGGASQTVFGARSASMIGRLTWVLFAVFLVTSLLLTMVSPWGDHTGAVRSDILQEEPVKSSTEPATSQQAVPDNTYSGDVTQSAPEAVPAGSQEQPAAPQPAGAATSTEGASSSAPAQPAGAAGAHE